MNTLDCQAFEQAVFEAGGLARALAARPDLAAHRDGCAACRAWAERFARGVEDAGRLTDLPAGVVARTGGTACARARALLGAAFDEPLAALDGALVAGHLETCAACRAVASAMDEAAAALPGLAEIDPGPAFTARVLAATSRRRAGGRVVDRWRAAWAALVGRPRFALEAAYALTLVLILVGGNPLKAWERTVAQVRPIARAHVAERIGALGQAIDARVVAWRDHAAPGPATDRAVTAGARSWLDRARQAWDDAFGVAGAWMRRLIDGVETFAGRIREWGVDLFSSPTEPPAPPARSRQ
jgi:predicted anti-sigma-YlaC factor YlaD